MVGGDKIRVKVAQQRLIQCLNMLICKELR